MSANGAGKQREGLSPQTLLIAAIASGVAAIVTSTFWKGGAIFTAALTPVIVSLVKEGLQRPMESEVMRRPVRRLSERRAGRPSRVYSPAGTGSRFDQPPPHYEAEPQRRFEPADRGMGPVHTYGTPRRPARRRWHVRAAIVTGVIAFAIAAIVLTVPELVFGGSVAGKGRTTIFSTSAAKSSSTKKKSEQNKTSTDQNGNSQTDTNEQNPPAQQPQGGQTTSTPEQQSPPSQTTPGGTPPPQQAPAPSTPPTGTTP